MCSTLMGLEPTTFRFEPYNGSTCVVDNVTVKPFLVIDTGRCVPSAVWPGTLSNEKAIHNIFLSTQTHTLDCHCIKCHNSHQKSSYAAKCTETHRNKRARVEDTRIFENTAMRNMDVDTEDRKKTNKLLYSIFVLIPTSRSNSVEAIDSQANLPFLDTASMFDNDRDNNDFDDNVEDEVNEIEIEDFNSEDPFAASDMPENEVYQFIAIFTVLFASRYVIDKGAAVLIEFINNLLRIYDQDFQLPTSLASLQKMIGFSAITKGI
ncbi:hypothetical protein PHYBLDRAFT_169320 [Phycomyces blakesleeanus NRRL 1555(-)]|uniref:Uncharacterized protein n=1 Tax=Phycomyces blakesleeanus (strain ATCC 8743b / DSM 1359 / FGSC 10004 / NBRC 33097 / NRRL 1555) TaxID=763407 RepID=A0A167MJY6_PHYB8|nr:hypothetical protein PHYBLDRAFT_169320 [Phycomyces blakesleeanus NRRL 1555(-)]OAD73064.1 hypothetical protein PHYBLDRAFT_169320 [Phycomyces blakesleeanus NRRL 1555(-)]|eukprot:XP_018291104.1 hypothetical protein PHYBLDRAFT_169320 [Phycomyces blakesleeanus NRRL 1555(-)]